MFILLEAENWWLLLDSYCSSDWRLLKPADALTGAHIQQRREKA
jgi:hypothetical protein